MSELIDALNQLQKEKNIEKEVIMQAIEDSRGGVLFIDEAYTLLTSEDDTKDFGKEVINALLTVCSRRTPD